MIGLLPMCHCLGHQFISAEALQVLIANLRPVSPSEPDSALKEDIFKEADICTSKPKSPSQFGKSPPLSFALASLVCVPLPVLNSKKK